MKPAASLTEVVWEKPPGHSWRVGYRFEEDDGDEMTVFGAMTAEAALKEARCSLDGLHGMNVGTYEIFSVVREEE